MSGTFHLSVVTPERETLSTEVRFVALPAYDGELGLLPKRAAHLTQLGSGQLRLEDASGAKRTLFVSGGFAQMVDNKLTVLTDEAREPETIDAAAAEHSLLEAMSLPAGTEQEFEKRNRAISRARAMMRTVKPH